MKIGVMSDIHGNAMALKAVCDILQEEKMDMICCLGDVIAIGHQTEEVLEMLSNLPNCYCVKGNHEKAVIAAYDAKEPPQGNENESEHHEWIAKQVTEKQMDGLKETPDERYIKVKNHVVYMTHWPMNHEKEYDEVSQLSDTCIQGKVDMILHGHDHGGETCLEAVEGLTIVNPMPVGCSDDDLARFAVIDFSDHGFEVTYRSVTYDKEAFIASFKAANVSHGDEILDIFYGQPQETL